MADQELDELLRRITAGRDYAHKRARELFAEADNPETNRDSLVSIARADTFRCIAQAFNTVLGVDQCEGDDYTEPHQPSIEQQPDN